MEAATIMSVSEHVEIDQIDSLINAAGVDGTREILMAFSRSTDGLLRQLSQDLSAENFTDAMRTAHALKGSAANVGAKRLAQTALEVEVACREQEIATARDSLKLACQHFEAVEAHFESHLTLKAAS